MSGLLGDLSRIGDGTFSARKLAEAVQWSGIEVAGVTIRYGGPAPAATSRVAISPAVPRAPGVDTDDSDGSGIDDDIPDEFDVGRRQLGRPVENILPLKPMHSLASEHQHNPNLVTQFQELSKSFKAWRPVRGDGNCYYRAVLFSWLERSLALGALENLRNFDAMLRAQRTTVSVPRLQSGIRTCHRLLKAWISKRMSCSSDSDVCKLLVEVSQEFNKEPSDLAFILCLRHLIAQYLRQHAHDPMGSSTDAGNVLTYESWARAIFGSRSIDDYCEQHVYVMNKEAADHVQHVCPRVLRTVVRICMVDRETARCNFIDYGEGLSTPPSGETVRSAAELGAGGQRGAQPEVFLLLKPGHYDVLLPRGDGAGRLLGPEGAGPGPVGARPPPPAPPAGAPAPAPCAGDGGRGLARLGGELCGALRAALRCLEEKLAEELAAKRRRLGSLDESLFEGQLDSVLDPLRQALERFRLAAEGPAAEAGAPLLPRLEDFFRQGRPGAAGAPAAPPGPRGAAAGAPAGAPAAPPRPVQAAGGRPGAAAAGAAPPRAAREVARVAIPVEVLPREPPGASASSPSNVGAREAGGLECCICMQTGAALVAGCGCAYHRGCLLEYVQMEAKPLQDVACHLHEKPLGEELLMQQLSEGPAPSPSAGVAGTLSASTPAAESSESMGPAADGVARRLPHAIAPHGPATAGAAAVFCSGALHRESSPLQRKLAAAPPSAWLDPVGESQSCEFAVPWQVPKSAVIRAPAKEAAADLVGGGLPCHPSSSSRCIPQSGNLGAALGVPCVICFGEDGVLKTLHCSYKVHLACLRRFWSEKVVTLCRLTDIRCPAEVAGCTRNLDEGDLRGVVSAEDLAIAQRSIRDVDDQNRQLIDELKRQSEEYRPMFKCAICLVEHEVEGCCTLPCQHRFCFESLQYHFNIIVRERRLSKLTCPAEGCGYNLRSEENIHIFQQCLSEETYHKLLEFLTRDDPHIYECKWPGCEERVFLDDGDDCADLACPRGHGFCGSCEHGPHPGVSCEDRQRQLDRERREEEVQRDQDEAWRSALALGWKPCPRRCAYGGGYKAAEECDHVTCECGFEFCWDCGVERQVPLLHDNRWHKPSCRYHTRPSEVAEPPRAVPACPECRRLGTGRPCPFSADDGYPESYVKRPPRRQG